MMDFQALAQVSAARGLNTILEGVALAAFSWLLLRLVGRRSAVLRFAVWLATLAAVVSLPLLPRLSASGPLHRAQLELSSTWATALFIAWAVLATLFLTRLAISLFHLRRVRRECEPLDKSVCPELFNLIQPASELNSHLRLRHSEVQHFHQRDEGSRVYRQCAGFRTRHRRAIQLFVSDGVRVPTAIGFFRPAVVLPKWALTELSTQELQAVVLHELAHLHRWDDWTNLAQKVFKALFFFHPAVWWIESRLSVEREIACDDIVVEQTNARVYGASLVTLAEKALANKLKLQRSLALAQNALGRLRQTSLRLAQILDPARSRTKTGWTAALATMGSLLIVTVLLAQSSPEIISFNAGAEKGTALSAVSGIARNTSTADEIPLHVPAIRASQKASLHRREPTIIPARAKARSSRKPKLELAKAQVAQPPAEFLLVFQTTNLDASGSAVWTLCVWRVTPNNPPEAQMAERIVMSRI